MRKWISLVLTLALLAAGRPVRADSAPLVAIGPNLQPMDSTTVRMESERIDITVRRATGAPGEFRYGAIGDYRITFHFIPTADETMTAGFPLTVPDGPIPLTAERARDFKVRVGGQELPIEDRLVQYRTTEVHWAVFTLAFHKGQPLDLEVTYAMDIAPFGKTWAADLWLGYVLKTGAYWAGTIGKAEANVRLAERPIRPEDVHNGGPAQPGTTPGWTLRDGALHWEWRDLEPDFDLSVLMTNTYWHDAPADLQALIAAGVKSRDDLLRIVNGTAALFYGDRNGLLVEMRGVSSAQAAEPILPAVLRLLSDYIRANPQDTELRGQYGTLLRNSSLHLVADSSHQEYYSLYNEERYRTWLAELRKDWAETKPAYSAPQLFPWFTQRTEAHLSDAGQAETAAALLELMPARFPSEWEARKWAEGAAGVEQPVLTGSHARSLLDAALQRVVPPAPAPATTDTTPIPEPQAPAPASAPIAAPSPAWPLWTMIAAGLIAASGAFLWIRRRTSAANGGK